MCADDVQRKPSGKNVEEASSASASKESLAPPRRSPHERERCALLCLRKHRRPTSLADFCSRRIRSLSGSSPRSRKSRLLQLPPRKRDGSTSRWSPSRAQRQACAKDLGDLRDPDRERIRPDQRKSSTQRPLETSCSHGHSLPSASAHQQEG